MLKMTINAATNGSARISISNDINLLRVNVSLYHGRNEMLHKLTNCESFSTFPVRMM